MSAVLLDYPENAGKRRRKTAMMVGYLMSYPIATVRQEATVQEAIRRLVSGKKGSLIVAGEGLLKECMGIVTTSQIFAKVFALGLDPEEVLVSEIMTPAPLITIGPHASAREAAELMLQHSIKRLPVVEKDALVGVITSKDLLRCVD